MATLVADQSTCCRMHVGAVLVKNSRVISIGFNGVPSGQEHCEEHFAKVYQEKFASAYPSFEDFVKSKDFYDIHGQWSTDNELHAEQNAILFAAKSGIATDGSSLYVTFSPCINCAKVIITAGIKKVYFKELYDRSCQGVVLLNQNGIDCVKLEELNK